MGGEGKMWEGMSEDRGRKGDGGCLAWVDYGCGNGTMLECGSTVRQQRST